MDPLGYTTDTSPEALAVQTACVRMMAPAARVRRLCEMSRRGKCQAIDAIRRRHPGLGEDEVRLKYIEVAYGTSLADAVRRWQRERIG